MQVASPNYDNKKMSPAIVQCPLGRGDLFWIVPIENHCSRLPYLQTSDQTTFHTHLHLPKFHVPSKTSWIIDSIVLMWLYYWLGFQTILGSTFCSATYFLVQGDRSGTHAWILPVKGSLPNMKLWKIRDKSREGESHGHMSSGQRCDNQDLAV